MPEDKMTITITDVLPEHMQTMMVITFLHFVLFPPVICSELRPLTSIDMLNQIKFTNTDITQDHRDC